MQKQCACSRGWTRRPCGFLQMPQFYDPQGSSSPTVCNGKLTGCSWHTGLGVFAQTISPEIKGKPKCRKTSWGLPGWKSGPEYMIRGGYISRSWKQSCGQQRTTRKQRKKDLKELIGEAPPLRGTNARPPRAGGNIKSLAIQHEGAPDCLHHPSKKKRWGLPSPLSWLHM